MGIALVFGLGERPVRSQYLDDYGALFMVDVNFPLLPLPSIETNLVENAKPATASTWEQAWQELYGAPRPPEPTLGIAWTPEDRTEQAFDAEKVERLRQSLFEAIKNAANIRQLTADLDGNLGDITRAIMTLQAKTTDIDRFAQGEITPEQFRELARTQTYPGGRVWSTPNTLIWSEH